ncbi:MAG: hypothetical protein FJ293_12085, partial [Planctomycetes bacterium]|nr:hypothetical protein [Planctomycetota bacterium]
MSRSARARLAAALAMAGAAAAAWASSGARDDDALARKAVRRQQLEALLAAPRADAPVALPSADAGVAVQHVGALSVALSEEGGFSAAV